MTLMTIMYTIYVLGANGPIPARTHVISDKPVTAEFCTVEQNRLGPIVSVIWREEVNGRMMAKSWIEYEVICNVEEEENNEVKI